MNIVGILIKTKLLKKIDGWVLYYITFSENNCYLQVNKLIKDIQKGLKFLIVTFDSMKHSDYRTCFANTFVLSKILRFDEHSLTDDVLSSYEIYGIGGDVMIDELIPEYLLLKLLIIVDNFEEKVMIKDKKGNILVNTNLRDFIIKDYSNLKFKLEG